jgi:hypothetical protein
VKVEMELYEAFETAAREAFRKYVERCATGKSVLDEWCEFEEAIRALRIYASSVKGKDWTDKAKPKSTDSSKETT